MKACFWFIERVNLYSSCAVLGTGKSLSCIKKERVEKNGLALDNVSCLLTVIREKATQFNMTFHMFRHSFIKIMIVELLPYHVYLTKK